MRYEIDYLSRSENTKKLADAVEKLFPVRDTEIIGLLHEEPTADADVYVIIFSFNKGTVPLKIMDMLDLLEGKTILFLVTLEPTFPPTTRTWLSQKSPCFYLRTVITEGYFSAREPSRKA